MPLAKILLCFDTDPQPSVFDAVVAVDGGADHLLRHGGVAPDDVRNLLYGAMFTRGPTDLKNTALFIGGADVVAGEKLLKRARECFFGPMRVSVMLDSNGANTTAAAAVLVAARHVPLAGATVAVLAATGSVGQRAVRLLAREGARVRVCSRQLERAQRECDDIRTTIPTADLKAQATGNKEALIAAVEGAAVVVAAGAPGIELLADSARKQAGHLRVAIDLNAVPPNGIGGVLPQDKATERDGQICYGAIGVGGTKMKLHKAAIRRLFESNDLVLDAEEIYALGKTI